MRVSKKFVWGCLAVVTAVLSQFCGGSTGPVPSPSTSGGGTGGSGGATTATITITNNTVSPRNVTVTQGAQVTFVNNDSRDHNMFSDPHPEHTNCPELDQVGFLAPGQSRQSGNLNTSRTCGFHDHLLFSVESLKGTITITPR